MRNDKLPESKFREAANERFKFIRTFHWQRSPIQELFLQLARGATVAELVPCPSMKIGVLILHLNSTKPKI